jgi:DNA-directed RNA polymerase specialized sigma24 family protein
MLALALADLSPALREVVVLHAWVELSHEEIAEALGCSTTDRVLAAPRP